jgi:hypothetical protein
MSSDTIDDLHYAEDLATRLIAAAREVLKSPLNIRAQRELAAASAEDYCRPSCRDGSCLEDCGCPAHQDGQPHHPIDDETVDVAGNPLPAAAATSAGPPVMPSRASACASRSSTSSPSRD